MSSTLRTIVDTLFPTVFEISELLIKAPKFEVLDNKYGLNPCVCCVLYKASSNLAYKDVISTVTALTSSSQTFNFDVLSSAKVVLVSIVIPSVGGNSRRTIILTPNMQTAGFITVKPSTKQFIYGHVGWSATNITIVIDGSSELDYTNISVSRIQYR